MPTEPAMTELIVPVPVSTVMLPPEPVNEIVPDWMT